MEYRNKTTTIRSRFFCLFNLWKYLNKRILEKKEEISLQAALTNFMKVYYSWKIKIHLPTIINHYAYKIILTCQLLSLFGIYQPGFWKLTPIFLNFNSSLYGIGHSKYFRSVTGRRLTTIRL